MGGRQQAEEGQDETCNKPSSAMGSYADRHEKLEYEWATVDDRHSSHDACEVVCAVAATVYVGRRDFVVSQVEMCLLPDGQKPWLYATCVAE